MSSIAFVLDEQASGIETRSHRTGTKNLKIKDGEDVDVLWRPVYELSSHQNLCVTRAYDATTYLYRGNGFKDCTTVICLRQVTLHL